MRSDHPPRLALALLERVARENEPLIGDMIEGWSERSDAWFWRQALLAAAAHMSLRLRSGSRATVEHGLVSVAMLSLLGFYAVVAASFMNHLLFLNHPDWMTATGRYQAWQWHAIVPLFGLAVLIGRVVSRFHAGHRIAAVLAYGVSTTSVVFLNLYLFAQQASLPPSAADGAVQTAIAMVFLAGLFVDSDSRSKCEPRPSS